MRRALQAALALAIGGLLGLCLSYRLKPAEPEPLPPIVMSPYVPHLPPSQLYAWVQANCQPPSPDPACAELPEPAPR